MYVRTMLRAVLAASAFGLCVPASAEVGQARAIVVASCGSVAGLPLNEPHDLYMTPDGRLCTIGGAASVGTNRSATVATTAGLLMAANPVRRGWKVKNDCTVAIWINLDTTAAAMPGSGNIKIAPGGYLASEPSFVETGAMSAIAETSACSVTAREH